MADAPAGGARRDRARRPRSVAWAPMLWEDRGVGSICACASRPRPFTDKELALLKTFADQAVIAIQNSRLFNETKEALERQTATSEVLRVISESPTDVQPVLDAVAQRAGLLCRADGSRVWLLVDGQLRAMTSYGPAYGAMAGDEILPLSRTSVGGRAVLERRTIHVEDIVPLIDSEYPDIREIQQRYGFRTVLNVPLLREGEALGVISTLRNEVRPFAPDGDQPGADVRRPGGDRDPERAAVQRDQAGARRGRSRQRGEELVPRDDEPRDPHADERGDRHERAAARHEARHRAARLRRDDPRLRRRAAHDHQRHPRLLEDRGRAHGHRGASVRPARVRRIGARPRQRARDGKAPRHRLRVRGRRAAGDRRRRDAAAPDHAQPALQRGEVHRARRGRADGELAAGRQRARGAHVRRARHRHRPHRRGDEPAVPVVLAGRFVDDAQVRRHRARPRDQPAPLRADGRGHVGGERRARARGRRSCSGSRRRSPICRRLGSATSSACSPSCRASAC